MSDLRQNGIKIDFDIKIRCKLIEVEKNLKFFSSKIGLMTPYLRFFCKGVRSDPL